MIQSPACTVLQPVSYVHLTELETALSGCQGNSVSGCASSSVSQTVMGDTLESLPRSPLPTTHSYIAHSHHLLWDIWWDHHHISPLSLVSILWLTEEGKKIWQALGGYWGLFQMLWLILWSGVGHGVECLIFLRDLLGEAALGTFCVIFQQRLWEV